jgi:hypothetical protein
LYVFFLEFHFGNFILGFQIVKHAIENTFCCNNKFFTVVLGVVFLTCDRGIPFFLPFESHRVNVTLCVLFWNSISTRAPRGIWNSHWNFEPISVDVVHNRSRLLKPHGAMW